VASGLVKVGPPCAPTNPAGYQITTSDHKQKVDGGSYNEAQRGESFDDFFSEQNTKDTCDMLVDNFDFDKWASLAPIAALARRKAAYRERLRTPTSHVVRTRAPQEALGVSVTPSIELTSKEAAMRIQRRAASADLIPVKVCHPPIYFRIFFFLVKIIGVISCFG
jgi:hypothetical protein